MTFLIDEAVQHALAGISKMLAADGFELRIRTSDEGIDLVVEAGPDSCADCLVPKAVFTGVITDELVRQGIDMSARKVSLAYPLDS